MKTPKLALILTSVMIASLALAATAAQAGPPGKWTQVAGPVGITTEPGLARTADGTLHLTWPTEGGLGGTVNHSAISSNAKTVSGPNPVFSYTDGLNKRMALVAVPGGLRAFFAGLVGTESNPLQGRLATATSSDGVSWTMQADSASNNTDSKSSVYAGDGISAALGLDGVFTSAWGSAGAGYHFGLSSADPDMRYPGDAGTSIYAPGLGVDAITGEVVLAWQYIGGPTGIAYQTIRPAVGAQTEPPGGKNAATSTRSAITGRIGAPGVYLAYLKGTNQFMSDPALVRTGSGSVITFNKARGAQRLGIAAAPGGRLWVFWTLKGKITAVRSNTTVTKFGARVTIKPPKGTDVIYNLAGEGSIGPLDLIALISKSTSTNEWHQRIMPALTLKAKSASGKIKFTVTDAGDPVKGAKVKAGGKSKKTNAAGRATIKLSAGRYKAKATKTGYTSAKVTARAH